jgi:hypothetical protein
MLISIISFIVTTIAVGFLLARIAKLQKLLRKESEYTQFFWERYNAIFAELSQVRGNNARWTRVELENAHHNADKVVNRLQFAGLTYDFTDEAVATALTRGQRNTEKAP